MKAYGYDQLSKIQKMDFTYPDVIDLAKSGRKSSLTHKLKKSGEYGAYKNSSKKRRIRRFIKKYARRDSKEELRIFEQ